MTEKGQQHSTTSPDKSITFDPVVPVFQPIFRKNDGALVGYETLARIKHGDNKLTSPEQFLNSLSPQEMYQFDMHMFKHACAFADKLVKERDDGNELFVGVNLTPATLATNDMTANAHDILSQHARITSKNIKIEIHESEIPSNQENAFITNLQRLKGTGHPVVLDDFGSKHSNLERANTLSANGIQLDGLKTPPELVTGAPWQKWIVTHAMNMAARHLSLNPQHTQEGASFTNGGNDHHHFLQGFDYGRPLTADKAVLVAGIHPAFSQDMACT